MHKTLSALAFAFFANTALAGEHGVIDTPPPTAEDVAYVAQWGAQEEMHKCPFLFVTEANPKIIIKIVPSGNRMYKVTSRFEGATVSLEIRIRNPNFRLMSEMCGETWVIDRELKGTVSDFGDGACYAIDQHSGTRTHGIEMPEEFATMMRSDYISALIELKATFRQCDKLEAGKENDPDE